jgi:hypothetical protein
MAAEDTATAVRPPAKGAGKPGKGAKGAGKSDKAKRAAGAGATGSQLLLAEHPRALRAIAQAKAWSGLGGFLLGGYLSLPTHTLADTGFRALVAGVVCYVAAWGAAVFLWRRLVVVELRHAQQEALDAELARLRGPDNGAPAGLPRGRARAGV